MRRAQISFSGAVDLNTFDLPAAVRRNERNPFALEKEAYSLGSVPQRKLSPVFDERNRPSPRPPEEDADLLPITEQPRPLRRIRRELASPPPDDESEREKTPGKGKTTLLRLKPNMRTVEDEQKEETTRYKSSAVSKSIVAAKEDTVHEGKPVKPVTAKPAKVKPVSVAWPGQDDYCAQSCILWCCCCVGRTKWPPKRRCCREQTLFEFCCPCCRVRICCPCCVECCDRYSCRTCCEGMGKYMRKECCVICVDISDDEEEDNKDDEKSKKNEKDKKDGKDKKDEKDKKDGKKNVDEKKK
ncbi:hypothetical protein KP79_PYT01566 [Mizuhopecten yessoensis]|uniref:Uncharacterized protein n=2 Tax=Mizuhopecten yessoensis TaxID=6573 RepID=A0A210Q9X4_MIZYE|nr:hypothetical protein KP79_PYT01566 [Mizuhopecten yessoensis]